jgi:hypothetical protein
MMSRTERLSGETEGTKQHGDGLWAQTGNLLLSGWLVVSAVAWDAGNPARINALVVGYFVFVFSAVGTVVDGVRALNTLLGLWLLASVWVFPATLALMRWNTALLGAIMLVLSLVLSLVSRRGLIRPPPLMTLLRELESPSAHAR